MLTIKFGAFKVDKLSVYELLLFNVCTFLLLIKNTNKNLNWNSMFLLLLAHSNFIKSSFQILVYVESCKKITFVVLENCHKSFTCIPYGIEIFTNNL